ncbi:MAG: hypothetical protein ABJA34_01180 [Pseudonocardiales bacterium]
MRQHQSLVGRRQVLIEMLCRQQPAPQPPHFPAPPAPTGWAAPRPIKEASPHSVQGVLLGLGGLLLAVADMVFTVVVWSRFGLAGRTAILLSCTAVTPAPPA